MELSMTKNLLDKEIFRGGSGLYRVFHFVGFIIETIIVILEIILMKRLREQQREM